MEGTKKRREFIKDRIYEDVRHDIITFRYQPGEKLSEYSLAEKFGVSRSPVRSVLQKLESESLVVIDPQRGTFVTKLDYDYIRDIIYLRWCVESTLMCQIADQQPKALLLELRKCLENQKDLLQSDAIDPEEFTALDNAFHETIYTGSHRENLWDIIQEVNTSYLRFRMLDLVEGNSHRQIYQDHCKLVQFMEHNDQSELRSLLHQHLNGNLQNNEGIKLEYKEYFTA
ncbi:GntR family transcriptional regulator [Agathobaculum sp. Marseille-P7918]|uniref:GntR family transcriptional regulator n=1 Tax=Agathobaculum sp. Marseille-P7918 TaxID=2479843 RepID=UPI000F64460D|nr:GntR family transcriptional regulator [Agathobaculum sp. Marseille-P7918]